MKNIYLFMLLISLIIIESSYAQSKDTIRGKIINSINFNRPKGDIYIVEKGTLNKTMADSLGLFSLILSKDRQTDYILEITVANYNKLEYSFKSEWSKRRKPKSIVIIGTCDLSKEKAQEDWKDGTAKVFLITKESINKSKKDKKFEKKYDVEYYSLNPERHIYECIKDYNERIFKILDIKYSDDWRTRIRKDVIGIK